LVGRQEEGHPAGKKNLAIAIAKGSPFGNLQGTRLTWSDLRKK